MDKVKQKIEEQSAEESTQSNDHQNFLRQIIQKINRQVVGLASTIAFYNLHQMLGNLNTKPLTVIVGGLQYTGSVKVLKRHIYWRKITIINIWNLHQQNLKNNFFAKRKNLLH